MPSNTHKSAAVPFVNQKGERSMKRVKVERYVAGKKPAYAKDEDEEDEYYTTDEEDEEYEDEEEDYQEAGASNRRLDYDRQDSSSECESSSSNGPKKVDIKSVNKHQVNQDTPQDPEDEDDDDDDDDPRFRRLKQLESKADTRKLIDVQRTHQIQPKYELKNVVIEEDDDEEEIRQRHALARKRQLEEPTGRVKPTSSSDLNTTSGPQVAPEENYDEDDEDSRDGRDRKSKRLDTDDLLKDFKLTGISRSVRERLKTEEEEKEESRCLKEMIEKAKQEAAFTNQIHQKIDEDIKKEIEKEALAKGDIGAREMTSVNTDDEDDELAYEEWKLREIKRVLRDRSERMLAASNR